MSRDPVYDVLELRRLEHPAVRITDPEDDSVTVRWEPGEPVEAWVPIADEVRAASARRAIELATEDRTGDSRFGTFAAVTTGTIKPKTRGKRVTEQDVWED